MTADPRAGVFITLEGIEGTGKSTQARLLSEAICRRGLRVVSTREPGGTRIGSEFRRILLGMDFSEISSSAELFLYMADRAQHMAEIIVPALAEGKVVVCDRFADATMAYQGYGRGLSRETIRLLNDAATSRQKPHLTVLLDVEDVPGSLRRAVERNLQEGTNGREDRFEREEMDFHCRVRDGYRALAAEEPERFRVIDASRTVGEVHESVIAAVDARLASPGNRVSAGAGPDGVGRG